MRLTLRTLLAYLDDTLDPAEIREIGQKVAESDAAQELIARIKQVTRRRRLTTPPPTGPQARFEANTAAEYLENVLPPEQIAEVEKLCLESDAHLSEIAACHQILTLVLGEPALVPPTAKQRMYALMQGKAAVTRKAKAPAVAAAGHAGDGHEADETLLLGMPPLGKGWNTRYLMPAAAVMLVAALAVAIYMALPKRHHQQLASNLTTNRERPQPPNKDQPTPGSEYETLAMLPRAEVVKVGNGDGSTTEVTIKLPPPSTDRKEVGKVALVPGNAPTLVLQQRGQEGWRRLQPVIDPVFTHDPLLTLPGFRAEIRLDAKVHLLLWGNLQQQIQSPYLAPALESALTLHAVSADKPDSPEVDFTLERGRVTITNQKSEPARVRVRFHEDVWDVTLQEPGSEVGIELRGREGGFQTGERPVALLTLFTLKGHAKIKIGYHHFALQAPPGPALVDWNNSGSGALGPWPIPEMLPWWTKTLPAPWQWEKLPPVEQKNRMNAYVDMENSLQEMSKRLTRDKSLSVLLDEDLTSPRASTRELAVLARGATGGLSELLTALADEKHPDVREAAVIALRHWLGREQGQDKKLRQAMEEKRYPPNQIEIIHQLLHNFTRDALTKKDTYGVLIEYLRHDNTAIRQLANWHLINLVPESRKIPYDPGASKQQNAVGYEQWRKLLDEGKLPPRQAPPPPKG